MTITIIGTSHIAKQSIDEIKNAIADQKPDIVAVELDLQRAQALMQNQTNRISLAHIRRIGIKGYLFAKIGQIVQQKLGRTVGVTPGEEMKTAIIEAHRMETKIAFIDRPISITLKRFSKALTWKERGRFVADIVKGIFSPRKQMRELGLETFDLEKVPKKELIEKMMQNLKKRFPSIYRTLVSERNEYMVKKLQILQKKHPESTILAIVGAGHKEGMEKLLAKHKE